MSWISVEDRLPEASSFYLVAFRNGGVWLGWFYKEKWFDVDDRRPKNELCVTEFGDDLTVTHWQPLPSPPTRTASGPVLSL